MAQRDSWCLCSSRDVGLIPSPMGSGSSIATAVAWVATVAQTQSLAQELACTVGRLPPQRKLIKNCFYVAVWYFLLFWSYFTHNPILEQVMSHDFLVRCF